MAERGTEGVDGMRNGQWCFLCQRTRGSGIRYEKTSFDRSIAVTIVLFLHAILQLK